MLHRCIWCVTDKLESEFNVEHVMPQAFGTFEQNFTLIHTVCAACCEARSPNTSTRRSMSIRFLKATSAMASASSVTLCS